MGTQKEKVAEAKRQAIQAFKETQMALKAAVETRNEVNKNIRSLQHDLIQLAPICGVYVVDPISKMGLTSAIRFVLGNAFVPIDAQQIKSILVEAGVKIPESNPMAAVQTTLKRLIESKEVRSVKKDATEEYEWTSKTATPVPPILEWMTKEIDEEKAMQSSPYVDSYPF